MANQHGRILITNYNLNRHRSFLLQKEEEMNKRLVVPVFFFLIQIPLLPAWADVTMPAMFSDHAVLQRDMMIPVWGTASPGEGVTVNFAGHEISTAASGSGDWMVLLDPMPANASPETMTIPTCNGPSAMTAMQQPPSAMRSIIPTCASLTSPPAATM
jgi:hypothetical protein